MTFARSLRMWPGGRWWSAAMSLCVLIGVVSCGSNAGKPGVTGASKSGTSSRSSGNDQTNTSTGPGNGTAGSHSGRTPTATNTGVSARTEAAAARPLRGANLPRSRCPSPAQLHLPSNYSASTHRALTPRTTIDCLYQNAERRLAYIEWTDSRRRFKEELSSSTGQASPAGFVSRWVHGTGYLVGGTDLSHHQALAVLGAMRRL